MSDNIKKQIENYLKTECSELLVAEDVKKWKRKNCNC